MGTSDISLVKYYHEAGARLIVTDVAEELLERTRVEFGARVVLPDEIYAQDCDIFAPCSVGAVMNDETVPKFRCKGIAGSANNVLAEPQHAKMLMERGIIYGPDYLVNSGGLIRCQEEVLARGVDDERVLEQVAQIYDQTLEVIRIADERGITTAEAADRLAEERIARVRNAGSIRHGFTE